MNRLFFIALLVATVTGLNSCTNPDKLFIKYEPIDSHWSYQNKKIFSYEVTDASKPYNIYLRLRNTDEYLYNNLWLGVHIRMPDGSLQSERINCTLADDEGKWLGSGLKGLYDNKIQIKNRYRFPKEGNYEFIVEHIMRKDSIVGLSEIGLQVSLSQ